jgi:hypothetical protein
LPDQTKYLTTYFKGQTNANFMLGEIRDVWFGNCVKVGALTNGVSGDACLAECLATPLCQFVGYDTKYQTCQKKSFVAKVGQTVSFRSDPRPLNDRPTTEGTVTLAGNTGVVGIAANLVPAATGLAGQGKGKMLLVARPEYRKQPLINFDALLPAGVFPRVNSGEISSLYDPTTEASRPIHVSTNIFCHAQVNAENFRSSLVTLPPSFSLVLNDFSPSSSLTFPSPPPFSYLNLTRRAT